MDERGLLNRLPGLLFGSWLERHSRGVVITTILLSLGIILLLGIISAKEIRKVVIEDFNQQQLVLARHAASQVENRLNILKRELLLLSLSPSIQYSEKVSIGKRMEITFSGIKGEGALNIKYIESGGSRAYLIDGRGYKIEYPSLEEMDYLKWARIANNKGNILISEPITNINVGKYKKLMMKMMIPVWQISVDEKYPVATNKFSGILIFDVDVTALIEKTTNGIRSGKTGYAWVIDNKGAFLYHPEAEFIGKNAFEARKERNPAISFARINEIQRELMLTGREGASWYLSGWHGGREGRIKKMIAFTPVQLQGGTKRYMWSVAVVAPITEIEGSIHRIQIRQFILEGFVVIIILSGGLFIIGMMVRWSSLLKKEVEEKTTELRKSENQYRSLIENANDIIFTLNRDGYITSINQAGCSFFKKAREEIIGSNIGEICFNEESAFVQYRAIDETFSSRLSKQLTYPVNINGNEYWLSTNFSGLLDEKGDVYSVLGIARDITERVKMQEQMFHTEKLASMGTLAAGVAHEINNPLSIILGFTDLLLEKAPSDSELQDILKSIENQGIKAKRVVENLLTFARYKEHVEEDVDINKNIEAILKVVDNTLSLNKIAFRKEMTSSLPAVKGDPDELQQVFFNIITNAVHTMKGGGTLTISTLPADNGSRAKIMISDTGGGIKSEYRKKIFDPLFTTKKVGEGTGLGLFVSYGIIKKHGGTIAFETKTKEESEKTGTTFIITLPAIKAVNRE